MGILEQLGIDWKLLAAQIVNFLVLFFVLWRLLYKPVLKMMKDREKTIEKGLQQAKDAAKQSEKANEDYQAELTKAKTEARAIVDVARIDAEQLQERMASEASKKVDQMLEKAKTHLALQKKAMLDEVRREVATLIVEATEKVASTKLEKSDDALIRDAVDSLKK